MVIKNVSEKDYDEFFVEEYRAENERLKKKIEELKSKNENEMNEMLFKVYFMKEYEMNKNIKETVNDVVLCLKGITEQTKAILEITKMIVEEKKKRKKEVL